MTVRERAEKYLKVRFPEYQKDASVMHVDVEVFEAGFKEAIALAAEIAEKESQSNIESPAIDWYERHRRMGINWSGVWIERKIRALLAETPPGACL